MVFNIKWSHSNTDTTLFIFILFILLLMLTITEQIHFTTKNYNEMLIDVNTLVKKTYWTFYKKRDKQK